jgi:Stage II sporulation protein E (SpoIIE)
MNGAAARTCSKLSTTNSSCLADRKRSAAWSADSPETTTTPSALTTAPGTSSALRSGQTASCVYAQLDAQHGAWGALLANAGHPPPLLITDDAATYLEHGAEPLLGAGFDQTRSTVTVTLPPGSTLLLYTDGLIERRDRSLDDGLASFRAAAAGVTDRPIDHVCDELLTRLAAEPDHNVCLLACASRTSSPRPEDANVSVSSDCRYGGRSSRDRPRSRRCCDGRRAAVAPGIRAAGRPSRETRRIDAGTGAHGCPKRVPGRQRQVPTRLPPQTRTTVPPVAVAAFRLHEGDSSSSNVGSCRRRKPRPADRLAKAGAPRWCCLPTGVRTSPIRAPTRAASRSLGCVEPYARCFPTGLDGAGPASGTWQRIRPPRAPLPRPKARAAVVAAVALRRFADEEQTFVTRAHAEDGVDRRWIELQRQAEHRQRLRWSLQHHMAVRCEECGLLFPVPEGGRQALTLCPWCRPARSMTAPTTTAQGPNAIATSDTRRSGGHT